MTHLLNPTMLWHMKMTLGKTQKLPSSPHNASKELQIVDDEKDVLVWQEKGDVNSNIAFGNDKEDNIDDFVEDEPFEGQSMIK